MRTILLFLILSLGLLSVNQTYADSSKDDDDAADFPFEKICANGKNPGCDDQRVGGSTVIRNIEDGLDPAD